MKKTLWFLGVAGCLAAGCYEGDGSGSEGATDITDFPGDPGDGGGGGGFQRAWTHASPTSALVFWQLESMADASRSYVRYGTTPSYGSRTEATTDLRWAHLHRIEGLQPATTYHYQMVSVYESSEVAGSDGTFTTAAAPVSNRIPQDVSGPPYVLGQAGATYVLTQDLITPGTAIEIAAANVTLDLDGHTVTFANASAAEDYGVRLSASNATVRNGHLVQGGGTGRFCIALGSRSSAGGTGARVSGITTDVHGPDAHPVRFLSAARDIDFHHNHLYSRVQQIQSRHYPGNDLSRFDVTGANVRIHDNLYTRGCHVAIRLRAGDAGTSTGIEVAYNDVRHEMIFTNGYAFACSYPGADIHHNKTTSTGRGVHLNTSNLRFRHNHLDLKGHRTIEDDGSELLVELHGIKFEGGNSTGAQVHDNWVRVTQPLPDAGWTYTPATPLNISATNPAAMNEVYNNTLIARTDYGTARRGGYGNAGEWAAGIHLLGMTSGPSPAGQYAMWIHDNRFESNDNFIGSNGSVDMTLRIEGNTFTLATTPAPTSNRAVFYNIPGEMQTTILGGGNTFVGMAP